MKGHSGRFGRRLWTVGLGSLAFGSILLTSPAEANENTPVVLNGQPSFDFDLTKNEPARLDASQMLALQTEPVAGASAAPVTGPEITGPSRPLDADPQRVSFGRQIGSVKWEVAAAAAYITAINIYKVQDTGGTDFHFRNEGWFGDNTTVLGLDKLTHAFNSYWITDAIAARIRHKTGGDGALPAAALAFGLTLYSELWDAHKKVSGFSVQDLSMNTAGAAFSLLRNTVPGLKEKLDFRLLLMPNRDIYTASGRRHFRQMRYLFAVKLAGFEGMERSPLRFVELHVGYRATGFTTAEEIRGAPRRQRPFVGIGLNLNELFFRNPSGWAGRGANIALQYLQVPYTAYHADLK